ncbi:DivIVA domain-containing protein [Gordonia shandongensis]|uniref:DivIVA domain-containing protein n=1 Tax=Gordonia shandongensis TaxID=376351 RepID=UPI0004123847|nr:DivIVA domain-containing protein [Gordonia shandongensis]
MPISADDVHHVAFSKPPLGRRGYDEDEVDAFLDLLEARFRTPDDPRLAGIDANAVSAKRFGRPPVGQRGYNTDEVDAFLGLCADGLAAADGRPRPTPPSFGPQDVLSAPVRTARFGAHRLDMRQVDAFLDTVAARFRDPDDHSVAWVTPAAIREARFADVPFGTPGYRAEDVIALLGRCATELAARLNG